MTNPLPKNMETGTFGELLVQFRLLQYGIQAAPPLKDSGNDLIAIRGEIFKSIQVKTSTTDRFSIYDLPKLYHRIALVKLEGENHNIYLDKSRIFLLSRDEVKKTTYCVAELKDKEISKTRLDVLF